MDGLPDPLDDLPGTLQLGVFSLSLTVADLEVSLAFYEKLGFVEVGGDREQHYLILKNGATTLGLFADMFERNILTFNPGLTPGMEQLEDYTDVREIQERLEEAGLTLVERVETEEGAGHLTLEDPDGNPILIDQFF